MANVYYAKGRYYIIDSRDTKLPRALNAVRVEGSERDWVLSQDNGFIDCGGFVALEAWY